MITPWPGFGLSSGVKMPVTGIAPFALHELNRGVSMIISQITGKSWNVSGI